MVRSDRMSAIHVGLDEQLANPSYDRPHAVKDVSWKSSLKDGETPITVHMIVKDEEPRLERVLASLVPLKPREVIVGDTGSTDGTKEIAKHFGCRVIDVPWEDHFGEARNTVAREAVTEWNLWIDADEQMTDGSADNLRRKILRGDVKADFNMIRFTEPPTSMYQLRLWRRRDNPWVGRIHEKIWPHGKTVKHDDVVIMQHHDDRRKDKLLRNMRLLQVAMKEEPDNHYHTFHAAVLSNMMNDHAESTRYANAYLTRAPREDVKTRLYMRYLLAWTALFVHQRYQDAANHLASCISVDPCAAEYWCMLGDVYWWVNRHDAAYCCYENALRLGQAHGETFWLVDMDKYDRYPREQIAKLEKMNVKRPVRHPHRVSAEMPE